MLEGKVGTAPALDNTLGGKVFDSLYRKKLNEDPFVFTPHSYDAIAVTALALAKLGCNVIRRRRGECRFGNVVGHGIRAVIRDVANVPGEEFTVGQLGDALAAAYAGDDINYIGASGPVDFDANGDVTGPIGVWEIKYGQIVDTQVVGCGFGVDGSPFCDRLG